MNSPLSPTPVFLFGPSAFARAQTLLSQTKHTSRQALLSLLCLAIGQVGAAGAVLTQTVTQYDGNFAVTDSAMLPLTGTPPSLKNVHGFFEYLVTVDTAGWYEFLVNWNTALGDYQNGTTGIFYPYTKYYVINPGVSSTYLNASVPTSSVSGVPTGVIKPGNVWLDVKPDGTPKTYAVRLENYFWAGAFPPITSFELRRITAPSFATGLSVTSGGDGSLVGPRYVGVNENLPIVITAGGNNVSGTLVVEVWLNGAGSATKSYSVPFTATAKPSSTTLNITVAPEGSYSLKYKVGSSYVSANVNLPKLPFTSIDATPAAVPANTTINEGSALATIDCTTTNPTYTGGLNDTAITPTFNNRVMTTAAGSYRETANTGFADCDHHQPAPGGFITWANYFAYMLPITLTKGQLYLMEVDYPDDADRSFLMEVRQGGVQPYQIRATGVDTGGPYPPTNSMKTHQIFFWPDNVTDSPRVVILNYQNGMRAAASKIRLYAVTGELPWLLGAGTGAGRNFGHWFEEAFSFSTTYGNGSVEDPNNYPLAITRWAKMLKYAGGDTLWVNASVYGEIMAPSNNYQKTSLAPNSPDYFEMILLIARKYGLRVVAEFHPQQSAELLDKFVNTSTPYRHLAVRKDGLNFNGAGVDPNTSPVYNPIYPDNQAWLTGLLKEFVLRYKTETAFGGVSIRSMGWMNPGLNNFHSLDWGYDSYTAGQFALNGGPAADPGSPSARYSTFTGSTYATAWNAFRVAQINLLYTNLSNTLIGDVNVRPNAGFTIYSPVLISGLTVPATTTLRPNPILAGIKDNNVSGFKYEYATNYGRRRSNPQDWASDRLDLTNRNELGELGSSRSYFSTANYAEDGSWTVPNPWLGLSGFSAPLSGAPGNPWVSGHLVPTGRYNLERYASIMANGDATTIINGGNNYFVDQDTTREFLAEYRQLPTNSFSLALGNTLDGNGFPNGNLVVREYVVSSATQMFYVVNCTNVNRSVRVTFNNACQIQRLSTGSIVSTVGNNYDIRTLAPFEMRVYKLNTSARITGFLEISSLETESLTVPIYSGPDYRIIADANMSGGLGAILDATAAGNYITFTVPNVAAGTYDVRIGVKDMNTRGIWQLSVGRADNFSGTATNVGSPHDGYTASTTYSEIDLGTWAPGSTSDKWFQFQITGKNLSSTGYTECIDYISLIPQ